MEQVCTQYTSEDVESFVQPTGEEWQDFEDLVECKAEPLGNVGLSQYKIVLFHEDDALAFTFCFGKSGGQKRKQHLHVDAYNERGPY